MGEVLAAAAAGCALGTRGLQPAVGDDRLGCQQFAERCEIGQAEYLGDSVVKALSRGAVGHAGQTLELLLRQRVEQVGEPLKLGRITLTFELSSYTMPPRKKSVTFCTETMHASFGH